MSPRTVSRRDFIRATVAAGGLAVAAPFLRPAPAGHRSFGKTRLNIGLIGTGGRGVNKVRDFLQLNEDIVALCDVDPVRGENGARLALEKYPRARRYTDYRRMFEAEKELDAVVVTTPDHMHAPISLLAMSRGLHVFCEKPLTRTVAEARRMREVARSSGVITQMGTQGSASHTLRRAVEVIRAGVLGRIQEVHIWCDRVPRLAPAQQPAEPPAGLDWDVWLGVAPRRTYDRNLHPFNWRWWTTYGAGPLGDMGCHLTNVAFRALDLVDPEELEADIGEPLAPGMFGVGSAITYRFGQRGSRPPLRMTWYDGGRMPDAALLESHGIPQQFKKVPVTEKLIIGDKGVLYGDGYLKLHGEERFLGLMKHEACLPVPETLPRAAEQGTLGHYSEWVEACKGNGTTFTSFEVAAAQTETVVLGAVAAQLGKRIRWDAANLRIPGEPAADALLRPEYRSGFTIA